MTTPDIVTNDGQRPAPVRIGIVGCGSVSHAYMAQAAPMECKGQIELVAACDVMPDKAIALQKKFGIVNQP